MFRIKAKPFLLRNRCKRNTIFSKFIILHQWFIERDDVIIVGLIDMFVIYLFGKGENVTFKVEPFTPATSLLLLPFAKFKMSISGPYYTIGFHILATHQFSWQRVWPVVVWGGCLCFVFTRRPLPVHVSKASADLLSGGRGWTEAGAGGGWWGWVPSHCWAWLGPTRAALPSGVTTTTRASPARGQGGVRPYPTMQPLGPYRALMGPLCLVRPGSGHHRLSSGLLALLVSCCRPDSGLSTGRWRQQAARQPL